MQSTFFIVKHANFVKLDFGSSLTIAQDIVVVMMLDEIMHCAVMQMVVLRKGLFRATLSNSVLLWCWRNLSAFSTHACTKPRGFAHNNHIGNNM